MIIENKNLSNGGFLITPRPFASLLPAHGLELCKESLLYQSPSPDIIGEVPDMDLFSYGSNINVGGLIIKNSNSDIVAVPKELGAFYNVLSACISNEYLCDPDARTNWFMLTITRSDVAPGESNRPVAEHWHRHGPTRSDERNARTRVVRSYTVADHFGSEFYVGHSSSIKVGQTTARPTHIVRNGVISVFTSFCYHRTPLLPAGGRRTVLILSSYPSNGESQAKPNPMFNRLSLTADQDTLLADWRANENALHRNSTPIIPHSRMREPGLLEFARAA